jgi:hypothetical protein
MKGVIKYILLLFFVVEISLSSCCLMKRFLISGPSKKTKTDTTIIVTRSHYYFSLRRFAILGLRIMTKTCDINNVPITKIITRITPAIMVEGHSRVHMKKKWYSTTGKLRQISYSVIQHKGTEIDRDKSYERTVSFDAKGHRIK